MVSKRKIRVLHVLKSSIYSGAESVVITIIKKMNDEYEMAYVGTDGAIREVLDRENISYFLLNAYSRKNLSKIINQFNPDFVHAHDFTASVFCASIRGSFKLISHLHHNPEWARKWSIKAIVYAACAFRFQQVLTVSQMAYQDAVFEGCLGKKMSVLQNPIDFDRILNFGNQNEFVKAYDLLYVGRFTEVKNPKGFIEIIRELRKYDSQIKSAMIGNGSLFEECKKQAKEYGVEENIDFLGFQDNPYSYMAKAKLLCVTSEREGYGLVAAEANVLGIPVISTKNGGVEELFGKDAIELCEHLSEFPAVIQHVLNNDKEYQRWKQRALERKATFVGIEAYCTQLKKIYKG